MHFILKNTLGGEILHTGRGQDSDLEDAQEALDEEGIYNHSLRNKDVILVKPLDFQRAAEVTKFWF